MIEVVKAKKYYNKGKRNQVTAIDNTNLKFEDKGLVAILGPSGCGKTTLLNMIGGLDKPDSGKIYVNGKRMNGAFSGKTDNIRNANIGYIFQNYHLVDDLTVFENVALPLKMLGVRKKDNLKERVNYALELVGLYRYRNRPATALSGGERQRVGIARAIVKNPGIIIADEPTGNLDSGNSIEVMNIIKTISKEKLVILVTHERNLAEFYADRIIEIRDGKVQSDRENEHDDKLDYRIDNKIYLKDLKKKSSKLTAEGVKLNCYSDGCEVPDVTLVVKNGNLYISCEGRKIEVVDDNSSIEFIDDNYHALSLEEAENDRFDFEKLKINKKKLRYHSVYNFFSLFVNGVRKVLNYPVLKKVLLIGFVASAMFIMYAVSSIVGIREITDDEFISTQKDYLYIENKSNTVETYKEIESIDGVGYILPGNGRISFEFDYSTFYYQTTYAQDNTYAVIASSSIISETDLIAGRLPQKEGEIVFDKFVLDDMIEDGSSTMVGLGSAEKFVGITAKDGKGNSYTIVGISDCVSPCVYVRESEIIDILYANYNGSYSDEENNADIYLYSSYSSKIKIKEGRMPLYDYEVLLPIDEKYDEETKLGYKLNDSYYFKVNGQKLKVCGFYESTEVYYALASENTLKYRYIADTSGITIYPEDKEKVLSYASENKMNIEDVYEKEKTQYALDMEESVRTATIIAAIVLGISLIEIFLMLRSSFLSRVKEVGTLRAIGLKKSDVYKMFLGEIIVITTITAIPGFAVMGCILNTLCRISFFAQQYVFNWFIVAASVVIIYFFNIIVGLLPVFFTLGKTPAKILSRIDVD